MGVYRVKVAGRLKPVLVKADSQAKAKDRIVEAELLNAEDMAAAMEEGETIWRDGDPFPDDAEEDADPPKSEEPVK